MIHGPTSLEYQEIEVERLEVIRPLWEKLKAHHVPLSPQLAARRAARTFDQRKRELLAKSASGQLKVEVVYADAREAPVAYCVTSLTSEGMGEIDSLFVGEDYRGNGVGTALTRRALAWLDDQKAASKVVVVAFGNDSAIEFYRQFGFVLDNISLRQVSVAECHHGALNEAQPIRSATDPPSSRARPHR